MTLAQFRTAVSRAVGLSTSTTSDTDLIDLWVNQGIVDFLKRTQIHKRLLSMTLTADEPEYTLDTDILSVEKLWIDGSGSTQDRPLERTSAARIFEMQLFQTADIGPIYYALEGAHLLLLHPAPGSSSDTLKGVYVPRPTAISATAGSPSATANGGIPDEYHPLIEAYAKWKAGEAEEHKPSDFGLKWHAEYEQGIGRVRAELNRKTGVMGAPARVGRRGWSRAASTPGTDIR